MTTTWDPAVAEWKPDVATWQPDDTYNNNHSNGFEADGAWEDNENLTGEFAPANISKHANDGGCRICGQEGHFARDCSEKKPDTGECFNCGEMGHSKAVCTNERVARAFTGECFNCGEVGHNKADCPNERVERLFTGTCRICEQEGHRAAECPQKPPPICKICKVEGHIATECTENRIHHHFASMALEDLDVVEAWKAVETADAEKDIEDIKKAIFAYAKAYPVLTFQELEEAFRGRDMNTFLIAKQQEIAGTQTIVNLQGEPGQKCVISFQFSAKPRRARFAEGWPESPGENIARLAEAGIVMDGFVTKCSNCNELGHVARRCDQEKQEHGKVAITCANCSGKGHRARDCPEERKSNARGCRNCGQEGHMAKECTEPPNLDNVECKGCGKMGHFVRDCPSREVQKCHKCDGEGHRARDCPEPKKVTCRNCDADGHTSRDCPEPKNMAKVQCRNCDEFGHESRGCKKPTDWSRVECTNCREKGHSYKRCTNPQAEETGGDGGWGDANANGTAKGENGAIGGWDNSGGW